MDGHDSKFESARKGPASKKPVSHSTQDGEIQYAMSSVTTEKEKLSLAVIT